jgi:hypothetical protein
VPYVFAHPAAVIPLPRLLGKFAVPSALVIGSAIPDAWYFLPFLARSDSHSLAGLFLFCLPAALFAYAAFHLIFKQPLLALLPQALAGRLSALTCPQLPPVPWRAVLISIAAGVLTHFAWDALTHPGEVVDALPLLASTLAFGRYEFPVHQLLQHGSTLLGTAFLIWWTSQKVRRPSRRSATTMQVMRASTRTAIAIFLVAASAAAFLAVLFTVLPSPTSGMHGMRLVLRAAGITALSTLGLTFVAYCVIYQYRCRAFTTA